MITKHDDQIMKAIHEAAGDAHDKHGPLTTDVVRAALILAEECGEVAEAALIVTRPHSLGKQIQRLRESDLMGELVQVATVAILMMANLIEGEHDS